MSHNPAPDHRHSSGAESKIPPLDQVRAFVVQLGDVDPVIRTQAVEALVKLGPSAVPLLVEAFYTVDRWYYASEALARIGEPAIDELIHCLDDADRDNFAADTLGKIGASAVPQLIGALQKQSLATRSWAALILGWIGDPAAIAPLRAALGDSNERVRKVARESLDLFGAGADASTP